MSGAGFGGAGRAAGGGGGGLCFVSAYQNQWLNSVSGAAAKVSESDGHLQENPKNSVLTSDKKCWRFVLRFAELRPPDPIEKHGLTGPKLPLLTYEGFQ